MDHLKTHLSSNKNHQPYHLPGRLQNIRRFTFYSSTGRCAKAASQVMTARGRASPTSLRRAAELKICLVKNPARAEEPSFPVAMARRNYMHIADLTY